MKRAVILHGTDGLPKDNWLPWLKKELEDRGYEAWVPELPNNHTPNRQVYNDFLFSLGWDFSDNLVIGYSSGAVSVLNLLMDDRCPKIKAGVLVGAWAGGIPNGYEKDNKQFVDLFPPNGFDFEKIKRQTDSLYFIHSDNDPYCPLDQAKWLAKQCDSEIMVISGGGHLGSLRTPEFPELLELLQNNKLL